MDYLEIDNFELNETVAKRWARQGTILFMVALCFFLAVAVLFGHGKEWLFRWYTVPANIVMTVLLFLLHEVVHGLVITMFKAKATYAYGVKAGIPYLATTTNSLLSLYQYKAVAVTPFVVISLLGLVLTISFPNLSLLLILPLAIHSSGAIGDLSILRLLKQYPKGSLIKDNLTGFTVYMGGNMEGPQNH